MIVYVYRVLYLIGVIFARQLLEICGNEVKGAG